MLRGPVFHPLFVVMMMMMMMMVVISKSICGHDAFDALTLESVPVGGAFQNAPHR